MVLKFFRNLNIFKKYKELRVPPPTFFSTFERTSDRNRGPTKNTLLSLRVSPQSFKYFYIVEQDVRNTL